MQVSQEQPKANPVSHRNVSSDATSFGFFLRLGQQPLSQGTGRHHNEFWPVCLLVPTFDGTLMPTLIDQKVREGTRSQGFGVTILPMVGQCPKVRVHDHRFNRHHELLTLQAAWGGQSHNPGHTARRGWMPLPTSRRSPSLRRRPRVSRAALT